MSELIDCISTRSHKVSFFSTTCPLCTSSLRLRSPGSGQKHLLAEDAPTHSALFMLMTRAGTSHLHLPSERTVTNLCHKRQPSPSLVLFVNLNWRGVKSDMLWSLVVLGGVCVCLVAAEGRSRTGTLPWPRLDGRRGQVRARPRRESSGASGSSKLSHGPVFTSCRLPLTPAEHKVLDDNTHEVREVGWECVLSPWGRVLVNGADQYPTYES